MARRIWPFRQLTLVRIEDGVWAPQKDLGGSSSILSVAQCLRTPGGQPGPTYPDLATRGCRVLAGGSACISPALQDRSPLCTLILAL